MSAKLYLDSRRSPNDKSLHLIHYPANSNPRVTTLRLSVTQCQLLKKQQTIGQALSDDGTLVLPIQMPLSGTVVEVKVGEIEKVGGLGGKALHLFTVRACEHFPREAAVQGMGDGAFVGGKSILQTAEICAYCSQPLWLYYQKTQQQVTYRQLKRSFQTFQPSQFSWKLILNEEFTKQTEIGCTSQESYCLPCGGKITFMYAFGDCEPHAETVVLRYRRVVCKHEKIVGGMCVFCMADVKELKDVNSRRYLFQFDQQKYDYNLILSGPSLQTQAQTFKQKLLAQKKCLLVLDLDNTILHSISLKKVDQQMLNSIDEYAIIPEESSSIFVEKTLVKFRPGFEYFLERAVEMFQIFIYTKGTRPYAEEICRVVRQNYAGILGNTRNFLPHRIISRDEDPNLQKKNLDYLIPKNRQIMLILDDRRDVWNHSPLCVFTRPYIFFYYVQITSDGKTKLQPVEWEKGGGTLEHKLNQFQEKCLKEIEEAESSGKEELAVLKIQELEKEIVDSEKSEPEKLVVCIPQSSLQPNPKQAIQIKQQTKQLLLPPPPQRSPPILRNNSNTPDQYLVTTLFALKQAHTLYFQKLALPDDENKKQGRHSDLCYCFQEYKKSLLGHLTIAFVSIVRDWKKLGIYRRAQKLGAKIVDNLSDPASIDIIIRPNNFATGYPESSTQLATKFSNEAIRKMKSVTLIRKIPIVSQTWIDICYEYNCCVHHRYFEPDQPFAKAIFTQEHQLRKAVGEATLSVGEKIKVLFKDDCGFQDTNLNR